jgi:Zn-dependent protease
MPTRQGSIRLFRLFGIDVYLHWSWFVVAVIQYNLHKQWNQYDSPVWFVPEYLTLFLIVLMHEFGHQLACRSVGGRTNNIVLWPFGGVAYVSPPQRPGAMLWSIVAGPLVNVALFPILSLLWWLGYSAGWMQTMPNLYVYVEMVWYINTILLVFNLLPVYPLDGGQILRSLLWFAFGRAKSLLMASGIGIVGAIGLIALAIGMHSYWLGLITVFILMNCWGGFQQARAMLRMAATPQRPGVACPVCKAAPPQGAFWICGKCRKPFDIFETQALCPHCGAPYAVASCPECGSLRPISEWITSTSPVLP